MYYVLIVFWVLTEISRFGPLNKIIMLLNTFRLSNYYCYTDEQQAGHIVMVCRCLWCLVAAGGPMPQHAQCAMVRAS